MIQFYCKPPELPAASPPAGSPPATSPYTLPPQLMKRHLNIILSQAPVVPTFSTLQQQLLGETLPPVQSIPIEAGAGEAGMQGRGKCQAGSGRDQCLSACGGACACGSGWGGPDCGRFADEHCWHSLASTCVDKHPSTCLNTCVAACLITCLNTGSRCR